MFDIYCIEIDLNYKLNGWCCLTYLIIQFMTPVFIVPMWKFKKEILARNDQALL